MIDLHCHLLPGVDDGPRTWDETLEMCRIAAADGVVSVVAAPHTLDGKYSNSREEILKQVANLNLLLQQERIDLKVFPGADVFLTRELWKLVAQGQVMTINDTGKYILLELPTYHIPDGFLEQVFQLRVHGLTPLISHPERNFQVQENLDLAKQMVSLGALLQVTSMSLLGGFGEKARDCAFSLLRRGEVHILATDAHSVHQRPPILSAGRREVANLLGEPTAEMMVLENPRAILEGKEVTVCPPALPTGSGRAAPSAPAHPSFWSKLLGRSTGERR